MKYLLLIVSLTQAHAQFSVNSLLTRQALATHPLANPVVPLTANGVAAAQAAAEVQHIDDLLVSGHLPAPPPAPIVPVAHPAPLHHELDHLLHHDVPIIHPDPIHVSVSHHHLHHSHHEPVVHASHTVHPIVHHPHHEPLPSSHLPLKVHGYHPHPEPLVHHDVHHVHPEPLVHHDVHHVHHEIAHLEPHHTLVPHPAPLEVVHHAPHHNLHHKVAADHLVLPHHHDHPPLLHPPTLASHAPLGACTPLCSVLDLLVFHPEFSTLVSLVRAAGLVELLSQPGPITLFAPTNAAFDSISPNTFKALLSDRVALQSVLLRHVTRGALHSGDFPPGPTPLVTGAGERVTVTAFPNQVTLTSVLAVSHIIDVDNDASNGVIHVVDSVF